MDMLNARKRFSSIAYGSNEAIVVHPVSISNVEKEIEAVLESNTQRLWVSNRRICRRRGSDRMFLPIPNR